VSKPPKAPKPINTPKKFKKMFPSPTLAILTSLFLVYPIKIKLRVSKKEKQSSPNEQENILTNICDTIFSLVISSGSGSGSDIENNSWFSSSFKGNLI